MHELARTELTDMGFTVVSDSQYETFAVRSTWCWDCLATNLTLAVYVRTVEALSATDVEADAYALADRAREADPFPLPVGFQHARAIIPVYIADVVHDDARDLCESEQPIQYGVTFFPVAVDRRSGASYYLRDTPAWGGVYFPRLSWVAQRISAPSNPKTPEPISVFGRAFGVFLLVSLMASLLFFAVLAWAFFAT